MEYMDGILGKQVSLRVLDRVRCGWSTAKMGLLGLKPVLIK
jgi:hypothetical protein